jgi:hypothetical protein
LAVPAALADLTALAGTAFFTAVTSTSSQGVVDLALVLVRALRTVFLDLW